MGPVAVLAAVLLIMAAPLMRGGNRQLALIGIEAISLALLLSVWIRVAITPSWAGTAAPEPLSRKLLLAVLLAGPLWLAVVYLVPIPASIWSATPGRALYGPLLADAGLQVAGRLPLSLTPDATTASLLAGVPLVAGFLAGYASRLPQLRTLLWALVAMAFAQVLMGLVQTAGGGRSSLNFSSEFGGAIGTFANTNHFANYIAMALAAYVWLAWNNLTQSGVGSHERLLGRFTERHAQALWVGGGLVLVLGILMSRSRGAALAGLPAAALSVGVASLASGGARSWRRTLLLIGGVLAIALALIGAGSLLSKFDLGRLATDASFRGMLASSTLTGVREFWPWGAGWGSYGAVYPRFQPVAVDGYAEYAHQDYAQMLFEGGIFALVLAAVFLWLAVSRAVLLARSAALQGELNTEEMAAALCGLGLLGLLVHSLVEFNMHIPANAIAGALLAGAYLRPLRARTSR
jgi:hypothetical protein